MVSKKVLKAFYEREAIVRKHHQLTMYKPQNLAHRIRFELICTMIHSILNSKKEQNILEVGCAEGAYLDFCHRLGGTTYGVDISLNYLKRVSKNHNIVLCDAEYLPFRSMFFDMTLCSEVLEHLPNPYMALREICRVSKDVIILSFPNSAETLHDRKRKMLDADGHISRIRFRDVSNFCLSHDFNLILVYFLHIFTPFVGFINWVLSHTGISNTEFLKLLKLLIIHTSKLCDKIHGFGTIFNLPFWWTTCFLLFKHRIYKNEW